MVWIFAIVDIIIAIPVAVITLYWCLLLLLMLRLLLDIIIVITIKKQQQQKKKRTSQRNFRNEPTDSLLPWVRVRCYGPGVEPSGPVVGAPTHFTIETFSAGKGKVEALLHKPDGQVENVSNCLGCGLCVGVGGWGIWLCDSVGI